MNVSIRLLVHGKAWKKDALAMIKNEEDQIFLELMKSNRAVFGGVDKNKADKDRKKAKRFQKEAV